MEKTAVQRWARVLKGMVTAALVLVGLALLLVPWFFAFPWRGQALPKGAAEFLEQLFGGFFALGSPETALPALFYWTAGGAAAAILEQARRVLDTVLAGAPFQMCNARALRRAAVCCWVISGAAAARLLLWLWTDGDAGPLFTYNTLFIPAFLVGGLLLVVMSSLFEEAARMQEDQDLTI